MHRHPTILDRRLTGAAVLLLLAAGLPGPGAVRAAVKDTGVAIQGRFIDESGQGVAGQVVRVLKSRTFVKLAGLRSLDQSVEEARGSSDKLGFFEIHYTPDPAFPYCYLRFYDPKTFDAVKYRLPEDRDVSKRVRAGRPVEVTIPLTYQADWSKVEAMLESFPPGSQVGQVLRSLGLPASRQPAGPGRELWTYDRAGVTYLIEGAKVIETHELPGHTAAAPGETPRDATPAVHVEPP